MPVRGGEDVELADEAARQRQAREAEHEDHHRDPEQRPLPAEARRGCRASRAGSARARGPRRPRRRRPTSPSTGSGSRGAPAPPSALFAAIAISMKPACEIDEYASIRLRLRLHERGEVPDRERGAGDRRDRHRPEVAPPAGTRSPARAASATSAAVFVAADMKAVTGRRRALVDVGRPHVERRRRGLEPEPDDDHRQSGDEQRIVARGPAPTTRRDLVEARARRSRRRRAPSRRAASPSRSRR